jgi:hypothetical protein
VTERPTLGTLPGRHRLAGSHALGKMLDLFQLIIFPGQTAVLAFGTLVRLVRERTVRIWVNLLHIEPAVRLGASLQKCVQLGPSRKFVIPRWLFVATRATAPQHADLEWRGCRLVENRRGNGRNQLWRGLGCLEMFCLPGVELIHGVEIVTIPLPPSVQVIEFVCPRNEQGVTAAAVLYLRVRNIPEGEVCCEVGGEVVQSLTIRCPGSWG